MATRKIKLDELVKVYHDLEKTLRGLKAMAERAECHLGTINVRKLITQLSLSKRRIERKIGNTLLLDKRHLKRRFTDLASNLAPRESE